MIELKKMSLEVGEEGEGDFEEEDADKLVFLNQMHYNTAITYCIKGVREWPLRTTSAPKGA